MGSCYSRKASGGNYTYTTVPMASTKHEEPSRLARPTPYTRNIPSSTGGINFKRRIQPPPKHDGLVQSLPQTSVLQTSHLPSNQQAKGIKSGSNLSTITSGQSSIPRFNAIIPSKSSSSLNADNEDFPDGSHYVIDSNSNETAIDGVNNMNNNDIISNSDLNKTVSTYNSDNQKLNAQQHMKRSISDSKGQSIPSYKKQNENIQIGSKSVPDSIGNHFEKIDVGRISTNTSKIPAKLTAHITGLPRPQLPHFVGKSSETSVGSQQNFINNEDTEIHRKIDPEYNGRSKKQLLFTKSESFSDKDDMHTMDVLPNAESHDSIVDSGLGSSINEKAKQEDSETLKDVEHLDSFEGSPVSHSQKNDCDISVEKITDDTTGLMLAERVLKHPLLKKDIKEGSKSDEERHDVTVMHRFNFRKAPGSYTKRLDLHGRTELLKENLTSDKKEIRKNASYETSLAQPTTYAAHRGTLWYQKIAPLKQTSDIKAFTGEKSTLRLETSNIPKIIKYSMNDGGTYYSSLIKSLRKADNKDAKDHSLKSAKKKETVQSLQSSPESDDKSDSLTTENGVMSPVSELENREFLIDDEIADQPGLISFESSKLNISTPSLQQSVTELHALQAINCLVANGEMCSLSSKISKDKSGTEGREALLSCSDIGSSCSSLASDDLMLDYEKNIDKVLDGAPNERPYSPVKKTLDEGSVEYCPPSFKEKLTAYDVEEKTRSRVCRSASGSSSGSVSGKLPTGRAADWRNRSVSLPLRPPRPLSITEVEDGSIKLDASSFRLLCQDLNGIKTLLLRLKTVIQEAETLNPFDHSTTKNMFYHTLAYTDLPSGCLLQLESSDKDSKPDITLIMQENADLRRQIVLLQQQLEEREHTIHLLQQQMIKYTKIPGGEEEETMCNAATQTERARMWTGSASIDESCGTLVSSSIKDAFEEHWEETSKYKGSMHLAGYQKPWNPIPETRTLPNVNYF